MQGDAKERRAPAPEFDVTHVCCNDTKGQAAATEFDFRNDMFRTVHLLPQATVLRTYPGPRYPAQNALLVITDPSNREPVRCYPFHPLLSARTIPQMDGLHAEGVETVSYSYLDSPDDPGFVQRRLNRAAKGQPLNLLKTG